MNTSEIQTYRALRQIAEKNVENGNHDVAMTAIVGLAHLTPTRPDCPRVRARLAETRRDIPSVHPTIREMPSVPPPPPSGTEKFGSGEIRRPTLYGVAPPSRQIVKQGPGSYSQVFPRERKK